MHNPFPERPDRGGVPVRPDLDPVAGPRPSFEDWESVDWSETTQRRKTSRTVAVIAALALFLAASGALIAVIPDLVQQPGEPSDHAFIFPVFDEPVRWNPCEPIHYVVNPGSSPAGSVEDVHLAVSRVAAATGVVFAYDGLTDEIPTDDRAWVQPERYGPGWAPVVIAWADPSETDISFVRDGDIAAAVARPWVPFGEAVIVSAWVVVSERDPNPPGFSRPGDQGPTVQHELGHVMGLDHVDSSAEMMHPAGGRVTDFGAGDLAGLEALGASGGCLRTPDPG